MNAIKNDFSIWGKITGVNKTKLPIHLRYAIDVRPTAYASEFKIYLRKLQNAADDTNNPDEQAKNLLNYLETINKKYTRSFITEATENYWTYDHDE